MDNGIDHDDPPKRMMPLELEEEERDSLILETAELPSLTKLTLRRTAKTANGASRASTTSTFLGLLRPSGGGGNFSLRNFAILATLALSTLFLLQVIGFDLSNTAPESEIPKTPPHQGSMGGGNNPGHYAINIDWEHEELPRSNVGHAVNSLTTENTLNLNGHYWHDPIKSPYTSPLYADPGDTDAIQRIFQQKATNYASRFGYWRTPEFDGLEQVDFDALGVNYRDISNEDFPANAWQRNADYLDSYLHEAKYLAHRVLDGIYLEYGWDVDAVPTSQREDYMRERNAHMGVIVDNFKVVDEVAVDKETGHRIPGVAYMGKNAWEGLLLKITHAMMTQDYFYVVAVGSDATYKGSNFFRTQVMRFNEIMQPVFDKLGMTLIVRNMGMDASTTVSALGGADVYGEADILWFIPDWTEETEGQMDLLHKQAILSGERMPVILTPEPVRLIADTGGKAWLGNIQPGAAFCDVTRVSGKKKFPPSARGCEYLNCGRSATNRGVCDVHDSVCWIDRIDYTAQGQDANVGDQANGYPNFSEHRWEGRKLTVLVLNAIQTAATRWLHEVKNGELPLAEDLWHVGNTYENLRQAIRLYRLPGEHHGPTACEELLEGLDPMICHMSMHVATEWTPRVNPQQNRLRNIITNDIKSNRDSLYELYQGIDVISPDWKPSEVDVDVHMLALLTDNEFAPPTHDAISGNEYSFLPTFDDDGWNPESDDDFLPLDDFYSRRSLRAESNEAETPKHRDLADSGWRLYNVPIGYCDGSAQSHCNRAVGNSCLLANHNHYKAGAYGTDASEWLRMSFPIEEGVILVRFEWQADSLNSILHPASGTNRARTLDEIPKDFRFSFSVDGIDHSVSKTIQKVEFLNSGVQLARDLWVFPILIDPTMSHQQASSKKTVQVGIRLQTSDPDFGLLLTHVYYA